MNIRIWGPPAVAVASFAALLALLSVRSTIRPWYAGLLLGALAWVVVAIAVVLTPARARLAARLQHPPLAVTLFSAGFMGAVLISVWFRLSNPGWVTSAAAAVHLCWAAPRPTRGAISIGAVTLSTLAMFDGTCWLLQNAPSISRIPVVNPLGRWVFFRNFVSLRGVGCLPWDAHLTYRLAPGGCEYQDPEYQVRYEVNSLGVRDDEQSLHRPEIIVLGDSFALGTGVAQSESFAERLESLSGRKVLNLGITSYGTVREMQILSEADLRSVKQIVIQYCNNDFHENERYVEEGNRLSKQSRRSYDRMIREWTAEWPYHFGKYSEIAYDSLFFPAIMGGLARLGVLDLDEPLKVKGLPSADEEAPLAEVMHFLNALEYSPVELTEFHLVITELNGATERRRNFLPALEKEWARRGWRGPYTLVSVDELLKPEDFFTLDPHINARGHEKVAQRLWQAIRESESVRGHDNEAIRTRLN